MLRAKKLVRRRIRKINAEYRLKTGWLRLKPSFFIIGTQKGGTTSLFENLREHPNLALPQVKELQFFNLLYYRLGFAWYYSRFSAQFTPKALSRECITGEASVKYLFIPYVAERLANAFPDARLIVMLRDPIARAHSDYQMRQRKGIENRSVEVALGDELQFLKRNTVNRENLERFVFDWLESSMKDPWAYTQEEYQRKSTIAFPDGTEAFRLWPYLLYGIYYEQLRIWFEHFPREQFLFIKSEDYFAQPNHFIEEIVPSFLGLPSWKLPALTLTKQEGNHYPKIDAALRADLAAFFKPYNERLYHLLGVDYGW